MTERTNPTTHRVKSHIRIRLRHRLRHWWFLRRLEPWQRELLDKHTAELDRRFLLGDRSTDA